MSVGILSLSFLQSLNKYAEYSEEKIYLFRALSVSKNKEHQTSELSDEDYETSFNIGWFFNNGMTDMALSLSLPMTSNCIRGNSKTNMNGG